MRHIASWSKVLGALVAGAVWLVFAGLGGSAVAAGASNLIRGSAGIEHAQRCAGGEAGRCFTYAPGILSDPGTDGNDVRVQTDDGPVDVDLLSTTSLSAGTRVLVERWDGAVVAVVDRRTERRYRTLDWPDSRNLGGVGAIVIGLALLAVPVRRGYGLLRRLRPPYA